MVGSEGRYGSFGLVGGLMVRALLSRSFDRHSLRGLQLLGPVAFLPLVIALVDFLQSNQLLVGALLIAWLCYLARSYGFEGWRISSNTDRSALDLAFNLTQGVAVILLPLVILGGICIGCNAFGVAGESTIARAVILFTLIGTLASILILFLFIPATALAYVGAIARRCQMRLNSSERQRFLHSYGGVSLSVLLVTFSCTSILAATQLLYRLVASLAV